MRKAFFCERTGLKKGAWTAEEDRLLSDYIKRYGHCNWRELPKYAGLLRCGKSCRLRWMNYLRPNVKRGNYTQEEDELIIQMHKKLGKRWATIARSLPGRTDNELKNHWHTHLEHGLNSKTTSKRGQRKTAGCQAGRENNTKDCSDENKIAPIILESSAINPNSTQKSNNIISPSPIDSETLKVAEILHFDRNDYIWEENTSNCFDPLLTDPFFSESEGGCYYDVYPHEYDTDIFFNY